jgi:hypothetical protein
MRVQQLQQISFKSNLVIEARVLDAISKAGDKETTNKFIDNCQKFKDLPVAGNFYLKAGLDTLSPRVAKAFEILHIDHCSSAQSPKKGLDLAKGANEVLEYYINSPSSLLRNSTIAYNFNYGDLAKTVENIFGKKSIIYKN